MENKTKYLFLIIGVIIGALVVYVGMSVVETNSSNKMNHEVHEEVSTDDHEGEDEEHSEAVNISDSELNELGIKVEKVSSQKIQLHKDLTGEIVVNPDNIAHVIPRFAGIVKKVYKKIGDTVKKDEIIATIESNESLVTYDVKSSIAGIVLELHMTPGELIGDDESHIITVADLSSVWAELNIYQKDLQKIKTGQSVEIYFDEIASAVNGNIFYLSPTVDELTRTATARVKLNNRNGYWKPGMFISGKVLTKNIIVDFAVSLEAIQNFEGQKVVFVKSTEGFEPREITIGKVNSKYAEVLSGLHGGEVYISEGSFVIKSELLKESFGGDDDH